MKTAKQILLRTTQLCQHYHNSWYECSTHYLNASNCDKLFDYVTRFAILNLLRWLVFIILRLLFFLLFSFLLVATETELGTLWTPTHVQNGNQIPAFAKLSDLSHVTDKLLRLRTFL